MRNTRSSSHYQAKGRRLRLETLETREVPAIDFKVLTLSNVAEVTDHTAVTSDDAGGIAVSGSQVFVTGTGDTGRFDRNTLVGAPTGNTYNAMTSDLRTQKVYTLGSNSSTPLGFGGTATHLLEINGATGALTGTAITLSSSITLAPGDGIFAGYGRVVVHAGNTVFEIALPTGSVTNLATLAPLSHNLSGGWAYWGVTEHFDGKDYLAYVRDAQTISRTEITSGSTTTVASFFNLGDMASITVSPTTNRWYFHNEGLSEFFQGAFFGEEVLGYAGGTFEYPDLVVTTLLDTGAGSLRAAVIDSNNMGGTQTIGFDSSLSGNINLSNGHLILTDSVKILGPGAAAVTVNGNASNGIFVDGSGGTITLNLRGLTLNNPNGLTFPYTVDITGNTAISAGSSNVSFTKQLTVSSGTLLLTDVDTVDLAPLTTINGTMTAANGFAVTANEVLTGTGDVNGAVLLAAGSKLAGDLTVTGNVLVQSTGKIAPGFSPGTITVNGNLTVQSGGILDFVFEGAGAGQYDQLVVNGTVNIGTGTNFNPSFTYAPQPGDDFAVLVNDSSDAIVGLLNNVLNRSGFSVGGTLVQVRYNALSGNDLELIVNNSPILNTSVDTGLDPILEDVPPSSNPGTTIDDLIATGNLYTEAQGLPRGGVAITGLSSGSGSWQFFSPNAGGTWNSFSTISLTSATLLEADGAGLNRIRFMPNGDFFGTATLSFKGWDTANGLADASIGVNASTGGVNSAYSAGTETAQIHVLAVNDNPVGVADSYSVAEDATLTVVVADGVLDNDSDIDGPFPLTASLINGPAHGNLTLASDGSFTYEPDDNYFGADSFTYKVEDGNGAFNFGTVSIDVTSANDDPIAKNDSATLPEDGGAVPIDVLVNDTALPDANETLTITSATSGLHGAVAVAGNGTFLTYIPHANYNGPDSFTYTIEDDNGDSATATVNVTVTSVNDLPNVVNDATVPPLIEDDGPQPIDVLANDILANASGPDIGETLTVIAVTQGQHGTVTIAAGGLNVLYTPAPNFAGQDQFLYTISDGNGGTATAAVVVTVDNDHADRLEVVTTSATITFTEKVPVPDNSVLVDDQVRLGTGLEGVLTGATLKFSAGFVVKKDTMVYVPAAGSAIKGKYDKAKGILKLTGIASPDEYEAALRTVLYMNKNRAPVDGIRTISIQVQDAAGLGDPGYRRLKVIGVNTPPRLSLPATLAAAKFTISKPPVAVAGPLKIVDDDNTRLRGATVTISAGLQATDVLTINNLTSGFVAKTKISFSFVGGVLTLTGNDTRANYLKVLKMVKFSTTSGGANRTLTFQVNDGEALDSLSNTVQRAVIVA